MTANGSTTLTLKCESALVGDCKMRITNCGEPAVSRSWRLKQRVIRASYSGRRLNLRSLSLLLWPLFVRSMAWPAMERLFCGWYLMPALGKDREKGNAIGFLVASGVCRVLVERRNRPSQWAIYGTVSR